MSSAPTSSANNSICSSANDMVAVTISPCSSKKRTTSTAPRLSFGANSCADEPRSTTMGPSGTGALLFAYCAGCSDCNCSMSLRFCSRVFLRAPRRLPPPRALGPRPCGPPICRPRPEPRPPPGRAAPGAPGRAPVPAGRGAVRPRLAEEKRPMRPAALGEAHQRGVAREHHQAGDERAVVERDCHQEVVE